MTDFDVAIIGGGVIGLAIARQLALTPANNKRRIVLIEKENRLGSGISSRSSEVIHAGLYYPKSYLKSTLCVRGREELYQYCREHQVAHKKLASLLLLTAMSNMNFSMRSLYVPN